MTQEYSEAIARDAMALLKGFEKHILPGGSVQITITPDGNNTVDVSSTTHTGATRTHQFSSIGNHVVYGGTYNSNVYGGYQCAYL